MTDLDKLKELANLVAFLGADLDFVEETALTGDGVVTFYHIFDKGDLVPVTNSCPDFDNARWNW